MRDLDCVKNRRSVQNLPTNNIWKQMKHRMRLVRYALDLMLDALRHSIADKSILRVD
jgi:hypothetical protein